MYIHLQSLRFVAVFFSVGNYHVNFLTRYFQILFLCINVHAHKLEPKYGLNYIFFFQVIVCVYPSASHIFI